MSQIQRIALTVAFASMLCDTLPKVGKRSQISAKRPLNGEQILRWVTVESKATFKTAEQPLDFASVIYGV